MHAIKLDNGYRLGIELVGNKARLVIFEGDVENVCRMETIKNLRKFIQSDENHLFKGRLQLHKDNGGINVVVKGQLAGSIDYQTFNNLVNCVMLAEENEPTI